MSYNIEKLNIQIYTNVKELEKVSFTRSMLTNPELQSLEELDETPYFTYDVDFSELLRSMTYLEQIRFIFNKDQFYRKIQTIPTDVYYGAKKSAFFKPDEIEIVNKNVTNNLMTVLTILFPTYYPTDMNISSSFDLLNGIVGYTFSITDLIPFFLKSDSMLKKNYILDINGKKYTLSKTVWINDIFNHSEYKQLPTQYYELNIYRRNEYDNLASEIENKVSKFRNDFGENGQFYINDDMKKFIKEKASEKEQTVTMNPAMNYTKHFIEIDKNIPYVNSHKGDSINFASINKIETSFKNVESMVSDQIKRAFGELFRQKTDIESLTIIRKTYINPSTFNLNYNNENENIKGLLTSKYRKFTDFADEIKKFVSPKECTNGILQQLLEKVYSNPDERSNKRFKSLMELYSNDESKQDPALQIGIVKNDEAENGAKYDIELNLELIGGELDSTKSSAIDCSYKNEYLGNMLEKIVKPSKYSWDLKYRPFYFDSDSVEIKTDESQTNAQQDTSQETPQETPAQTGGRNKTRRFKQKYLKTRKRLARIRK